MQGTAADALQHVGHGATLTGTKPSQWRQGQWHQQVRGPHCPAPCPKGRVLGGRNGIFLKRGAVWEILEKWGTVR
ncbi:hypothetical protein QL285_025578 [Trifolium repens]|nr:hypothetical protein QL285_025578 [Trifolium repens]